MTVPPEPDMPGRPFDPRPRRASRRVRAAAVVVVAAAHLGLLWMLWRQTPSLPTSAPEVITVAAEIVAPPKPPPPPPPPESRPKEEPGSPAPAAAAAPAEEPKPAPPTTLPPPRAVRMPPPPETPTRPTAPGAPAEPDVVLGEAAIAGATTAGTGGGTGAGGSGAGSCDMVGRLQDALRRDADIRGAVTRAHQGVGPAGRAILVWNGQWLRSPGENGKGLAGVRQAIAMEVAFAPPACRAQVMRGLVLISFNDAPGGPKLALGTREWRWSELLAAPR